MTTTRRRLVATGLLVALVAGACGGSDGDKEAAPAAGRTGQGAPVNLEVGGVYSPAATLRANLTHLLQEHVFLSGITTNLVLQGKDAAPAAAVLDANTAALGETFGRLYSDAVAQRFLELWRRKTGLFVEFAQATAAGDQAALAKVKADLALYQDEFGAFVNQTNPQLPADASKEDAGTHIGAVLAAITAQAKDDPTALAKLKEAAAVMPRTGAVFAAGIVKQMPEAFAGTADGGGATLLATFIAALQEHVYLLAATTRTVVAGVDDKKSRETLDESSEGVANLIGSVYGDAAGRQFLQIWRAHIAAFVDDAEAAAAGDAAAMAKAAAELARFRTALGAFLNGVNPNLPRQAVAADFEDYVDAVLAVIAAQAAGDATEFQRLHEAAATTPLLAELLAGAIARQFDTRFS
ncbi:MAG: hypothetical protein CYG61_04915 [Actinobacteria bacterium]|nr:MAG: hypothetical protein CYG61_04915 [Actinomycetota bacterium]